MDAGVHSIIISLGTNNNHQYFVRKVSQMFLNCLPYIHYTEFLTDFYLVSFLYMQFVSRSIIYTHQMFQKPLHETIVQENSERPTVYTLSRKKIRQTLDSN